MQYHKRAAARRYAVPALAWMQVRPSVDLEIDFDCIQWGPLLGMGAVVGPKL
jgi:hypothetical protein